MENKFKVVGMSAPRMFTCHSSTGEIFWAKNGLSEEKYKELFKWAKNDDGFWKQKIRGLIEYENLGVGETPINGTLKSIEID